MNGIGNKNHLKVLVFPEGDLLIAQCLDFDIAVQAPDIATLKERFEKTLVGMVVLAKEHGQKPLANIPPAPTEFRLRWENADKLSSKLVLKWPDLDWTGEESIPHEIELALA